MLQSTRLATLSLVALSSAAFAGTDVDWNTIPFTSNSDYQAVDSNGIGTFPLTSPARLRGVILNRGEQMLNATADLPSFFGGQWQIFIQTREPGDFGGTALYMAQRYGDLPFIPDNVVYTAAEWNAELNRLEHDPATNHIFRPGDYVEIRARGPGLFFGGKTNINEQHNNSPEVDFDIHLLAADCGEPDPIVFTLADVKDASDQFIFDSTRQNGPEYLQGSRVRLNNVNFVSTAGWAPDASLTVQDGTGRTLDVKLGLGDGFSNHPAPNGNISIIAIFDQEAPGDGPFTIGYRLWVMDYDGNGQILPRVPTLSGDLNRDGAVNGADIQPFLTALLDRDAFESEYPNGDIQAGNLDGQCGIQTGDLPMFLSLLLN